MERTASAERDMNCLMRLSEFFDRYPGADGVVVRLVNNGREPTAIRLGDGVRCCAELLLEIERELGAGAVHVRAGGPALARVAS